MVGSFLYILLLIYIIILFIYIFFRIILKKKKKSPYPLLNHLSFQSRITNAPIANIMIIWAKCLEDNEMRGFIVERKENDNRLITPMIKGKFSLRCSITGMILMDDLEVPEENMLPNVKGLKVSFRKFSV